MKITIVQGAFLPVPPLLGGAVEKIWFELGKRFAAAGHEVTHVSRSYPDLPKEETIDGVKHLRVPGYDTPSSMIMLKLRDLLYSRRAYKVIPQCDIIVTNTFWLPILAKSQKKGRLYVHVARMPKGQMRLYKHAARIQMVSSAVQDEVLAQAPELEDKLKVVPNPIDLPATPPQVSVKDPQEKKTLLYTGRIHPEKGLHLLIDALVEAGPDAMPNWQTRIIGPWKVAQGGGGEEYLKTLKEKASAAKIPVQWVEPIFDKEKLALEYAQADLFCYPSLADKGETFGVSPLEAMAHGAPSIVSDLKCFRDFLEPGVNGVIFDHHSEHPAKALAAALKDFASNTEKLASMGQAACQTAQNFAFPLIADQYLQDFQFTLK